MTDALNVLTIAKAGGYDRAALFERMQELAEGRREPGQTREQAFTKFITKDPDGSALYALQRSMPGHDLRPEVPVAKAVPAPDEFTGLVCGLMKCCNLSYSKAVDAALATVEGAALYAKTRRVEKIAAGFTDLDLATDDMIEAQRTAQRDLHKVETSAFDVEVDKVVARNPAMKRSAAIDFALTTPLGKRLWDEQKAAHQAAVAKAAYTTAAGTQPGDEDAATAVRDAPHVALDENPHIVDWEAIVDGEQARQPGISRSAAISAAMKTPKGQRALQAAKAARPVAAAAR